MGGKARRVGLGMLLGGLVVASGAAPGLGARVAAREGVRAGQDTSAARGLPAVLDSLVAAEMERRHVAGMSVAVVHGRDTVVWAGYGRADVEHDVPATPATVYPIASLTKQFTAAAVLALVEDGRLSLDAPVRPLLSRLPDEGPMIRVRHLLNHTSGLPDYYSQPEWVEMRDRRPEREEARDLISGLVAKEPLLFTPGKGHRYSNAGYDLLGDLVARMSGVPWSAFLRTRLLEPLGLARTGFCSWRDVVRGRADGYEWREGALRRASVIAQEFAFASGGLCSTVGELVEWSRALHGGGVIDNAGHRAMTTPEGGARTYGFGLETGELEGHGYFAHNGSLPGFAAQLDHYPDQDLVVAVLANTPAAVGDLAEAMARVVLGLPQPPAARAPEGWRVVAAAEGETDDVVFRTMGTGVHATAGPSALYFHPDSTGSGRFHVEATFIQIARPEVDEGQGLFVGGRSLGSGGETHVDFLVRGDGSWGVRKVSEEGERWIRPWAASPAVRAKAPTGTASNALAVEVSPEAVRFSVNGEEVARIPTGETGPVAGIAGLWVGAGHDTHVGGFAVGGPDPP